MRQKALSKMARSELLAFIYWLTRDHPERLGQTVQEFLVVAGERDLADCRAWNKSMEPCAS